MRSRMILKIQIMYFQELFTESKKLAVLSFSVVAKLARTLKSYTFLDFRFFQSQNWANPFYLAPDNFWNPIFGQVVAFHEFSKRYLGNWLIFWFSALFGGRESKKSDFSLIFTKFSTLDPQKGPKIKKLAKFPNNVWNTHEMQQLSQKWGSKSDLEPKNKGLTDLAKCNFWLIFANFSTLGPQKWPKIKNLAKFPNNLWKTHKMQQLGQKWGSKGYLEPKNKGLTNLAKNRFFTDFWLFFNFGPPKMAKNQKISQIPK